MFKMKKSFALVVSLVLVLTVTVGTTLAYLFTESGPVENIFQPSSVTTEVIESFNGSGAKTNVKIKNTGDTDAWIRATYIVTWQDSEGNVYGKQPVEGVDYEIRGEASEWISSKDGFCYYSTPVAHDKETSALIESIQPKGEAPAGYSLCVEIIGSGIQSKPASVFAAAWNPADVSVSSDGTSVEQMN